MVGNVLSVQDLHKACRAASLAALCAPYALDPDCARQLRALSSQRQHLARGELLYHQDDRLRALYVIVDGLIKTHITADSGREQITGFHFPHELIGLDALSARSHVCCASALRASEVLVVPVAGLDGLAARMPRLERTLLHLASKELAEEEELLFLLGTRNARQRVAAFLLSLCFRFGNAHRLATCYSLGMSRQEIGNYLGLTKETTCRLLQRFEGEGVVSVERKHLRIRDLSGLSRAAGLNPVRTYMRA